MTDVFLMVRRKKSTIFLSCKETDTVAVLKKMLSGIVRQDAEGMKVFQQCDNAEKGQKPGIKLKSCKNFRKNKEIGYCAWLRQRNQVLHGVAKRWLGP